MIIHDESDFNLITIENKEDTKQVEKSWTELTSTVMQLSKVISRSDSCYAAMPMYINTNIWLF